MINESHNIAFDAIIDKAAAEANMKIGSELSAPDFEFSKEHEKKMNKFFSEFDKAHSPSPAKKIMRIAASFAVVAVIGVTVALGTAEAWKNNEFKYFFDQAKPNTDFFFGEAEYTDDYITLHYAPSGFSVTDTSAGLNSYYIRFEHGEDYFGIRLDDPRANISVDTEDGIVEDITVKGEKAVYTSNPNINAVLFEYKEKLVTIFGTLDRTEMLKIAENLDYPEIN